MYILNIASSINNIAVKELTELIFENCYRLDKLDLLYKAAIIQ